MLNGALLQPDEFPVEIFDFVMDVNVKGLFLCVKYATPLLAAGGHGVLILVGSTAGVLGAVLQLPMGPAKGRLMGWV